MTSTSGPDTWKLRTEYQNGSHEVRVLVPETYSKARKYRVLYVLPVEADFEEEYGYGLGEFQKLEAHNLHDVILVEAGFEIAPWYGDHASNPRVRQASFMREALVPFIESKYSTLGTSEGRLLIGFSKSGWGAYSLILTYPDFFGYAAAWDAPMFLSDLHYNMEEVFGTIEQLQRYRPDLLIPRQARFFRNRARLVLAGEKLFGTAGPALGGMSQTVATHELLVRESIPHHYDDSLSAPHRWDKDWMDPTLEALMSLTTQPLP